MIFFATGLRRLNSIVLRLKALRLLLSSQNILHKGTLALLVREACCEVLGRALDDGADLRKLWDFAFPAVVLLVVSLRVQDRAHAKQLQVSLELGCNHRFWKVEPVGASGGFLLLDAG